jgi:nitrite reductase/ring-hydroxylating ferredoxin subunit
MASKAHRRKRPNERWHESTAGSCANLQQIQVHGTRMALSFANEVFGAIHGTCNHAGGPLGQGTLEGDYVVCPWHQWRFHRTEGHGERGFEQDVVPAYRVRVRAGRVQVSVTPHGSQREHAPHPLARAERRWPGGVVGISTTAMNLQYPRFSTSDELLEVALAHAARLGCGTQRIRLRELSFRHCECYYSKSARACTWPCSITQMDPDDQLDRVYEALVHWADVFVIATPIRWGGPSSLYFKMIERMNCIQNQLTIAGRTLLRNKVRPRSSLAGRTHPVCRRADARLFTGSAAHPAVRLHCAFARLERRTWSATWPWQRASRGRRRAGDRGVESRSGCSRSRRSCRAAAAARASSRSAEAALAERACRAGRGARATR